MKKSIAALALAVPLLLTAACAETTTDTSGKTGSNSSVAPDKKDENKTLAFGETVNYDDGLSITVSKPQRFKPSEWSSFDKSAPVQVKFKVTVVNGTKEPYEAGLIYITVQSGDVEAEEVFDSEQKLEGAPQTKILAGRQATYWVGFGIQSQKDIVMQVNDPLEREAAIFSNVAQ